MRKQLDNYEVICPYPYLIRIGTNLKGHGFLTMAMCCFRDTACMYQGLISAPRPAGTALGRCGNNSCLSNGLRGQFAR